MMGGRVLEAEGIVAGYVPEFDILHGVDIHVQTGETVCVIGPNGAGKSTLIKVLFGFLSPRQGVVRFMGDEVTGWRPEEAVVHGVGYVPQLSNVFQTLSVEENLEMGGWTLREGVEDAMEEAFALFPILKERRRQKVGTMSGGQRQMVAMARALMVRPRLLLLDEPSAGLAPNVVDEVFDNIQKIAAEGVSIILVEQNAKKGLRASDRGYVLDMGRNRSDGTGSELLDDPEVGRLYLGG